MTAAPSILLPEANYLQGPIDQQEPTRDVVYGRFCWQGTDVYAHLGGGFGSFPANQPTTFVWGEVSADDMSTVDCQSVVYLTVLGGPARYLRRAHVGCRSYPCGDEPIHQAQHLKGTLKLDGVWTGFHCANCPFSHWLLQSPGLLHI